MIYEDAGNQLEKDIRNLHERVSNNAVGLHEANQRLESLESEIEALTQRVAALEGTDPPPPSDEPQLPALDTTNAYHIETVEQFVDYVEKARPTPGTQVIFYPGVYRINPTVIGRAMGTPDEPIVYRSHPDREGEVVITADWWPATDSKHKALWRFAPGTAHVFVHGITFQDSGVGGRNQGPNSGGDCLQVYSGDNVSHDIVVSNCKFVRSYGKAVLAAGNNLWFLDNEFSDCCIRNDPTGGAAAAVLSTWRYHNRDGVQQCKNVTVRRNYLAGRSTGEGIHIVHADGVLIEDNVIEDGAWRVDIYSHNASDVTIRNNTIIHIDPVLSEGRPPVGIAGAMEGGGMNPLGSRGWLIEGNELRGDRYNFGFGWANWGPDVPNNTYSHWTIRNNQFHDWGQAYKLRVDGVKIQATTPETCIHDVEDLVSITDSEAWRRI